MFHERKLKIDLFWSLSIAFFILPFLHGISRACSCYGNKKAPDFKEFVKKSDRIFAANIEVRDDGFWAIPIATWKGDTREPFRLSEFRADNCFSLAPGKPPEEHNTRYLSDGLLLYSVDGHIGLSMCDRTFVSLPNALLDVKELGSPQWKKDQDTPLFPTTIEEIEISVDSREISVSTQRLTSFQITIHNNSNKSVELLPEKGIWPGSGISNSFKLITFRDDLRYRTGALGASVPQTRLAPGVKESTSPLLIEGGGIAKVEVHKSWPYIPIEGEYLGYAILKLPIGVNAKAQRIYSAPFSLKVLSAPNQFDQSNKRFSRPQRRLGAW